MNRVVIWVFYMLVTFRLGMVWNDDDDEEASEEVSLKNSGAATSTATISTTTPGSRVDGRWHSIDVFIGSTFHLDHKPFKGGEVNKEQNWFSEAKQDMVIANLFKNKQHGYFVDLASGDARETSNTYALENKLQWTGLCIEPNPSYWYDLASRNCQVVAAAVGKDPMEEVLFSFDKEESGGIVRGTEDKGGSTPKYTVPLLEVLERYNSPKIIDYLSLDVEGSEEYIMSNFPIETYKFKVMTIDRPGEGLKNILKTNGYQCVSKLSSLGETLWAHESFIQEAGVDHFKEVTEYKGESLAC